MRSRFRRNHALGPHFSSQSHLQSFSIQERAAHKVALQQNEIEILNRKRGKKRALIRHPDRMLTVDTLVKNRYYVLFIIHYKTREIVQFAITENPTREYLRQQMIEFSQNLNAIVYMIHDNAQQFMLNYLPYDIKQIRTSVKAPNMNSVAERFVKSARMEALDFFLLISENQIRYILTE